MAVDNCKLQKILKPKRSFNFQLAKQHIETGIDTDGRYPYAIKEYMPIQLPIKNALIKV